MRALVIAHEPLDTGGRVGARLEQRGVEVVTHVVNPDPTRPNEAAPWPSLDDFDLLVPMGSVRSLTDTAEIDSWVHTELDLIRHAHDTGMPVFGVCFGGQLIARALGGSVEVAPTTEIGWYEIEPLTQDGPVDSGPWFEWHHDRFIPPADAEVLARSDQAVQLIRIGTTVGTQFHPEVDRDHIAAWVDSASAEYLAQLGVDPERMVAEAARNQARSVAQCNRLVDWFLDEVVAHSAQPTAAATT